MAKNMNFVTYYDEEGNLKTLTDSGGGESEWEDVTNQGSFNGSNFYRIPIKEGEKFQLRFCTPQTDFPPSSSYYGLYITTPEIQVSPPFVPQYEGVGVYTVCTVQHRTGSTNVQLTGSYDRNTGAVTYGVSLTGIVGTFSNFKCYKRVIK